MTYGQILDSFTAILYRHDPEGLASIEAPKDEYVHEATRILAWLNDRTEKVPAKADLLNAVHRIFTEAFEPKQVAPLERYAEATAEMYAVWEAR